MCKEKAPRNSGLFLYVVLYSLFFAFPLDLHFVLIGLIQQVVDRIGVQFLIIVISHHTERDLSF